MFSCLRLFLGVTEMFKRAYIVFSRVHTDVQGVDKITGITFTGRKGIKENRIFFEDFLRDVIKKILKY